MFPFWSVAAENGSSILRQYHGAAASGAWVFQGGILRQEVSFLPQSEYEIILMPDLAEH